MRQKIKSKGVFFVALTAAFAMSIVVFDTAAFAQDVAAGGQIAKTWCSGCHLIDRADQTVANDATPSFPSIAQNNTTTSAGLAAFLSTPHTNMPNYTLTRDEIREVSAYIMSLRK
jgi:mono/diheme cytochrome c family protein